MKRYFKCLAGIWCIILILNITAWCSPGFCDWYRAKVFPLWLNTYGRFMSLFPFSVGEWMLYLAVLYLMVNLLLCIPALIRRKSRMGKRLRKWLSAVPGVVTGVCLIMTFNCTILYHCTSLEKQFTGQLADNESFDEEQLIALREKIVKNCNALSEEMTRDGQGYIVYEGDAGMGQDAIAAMQALAAQYPGLGGYYPNPKPFALSWFFSQQYMCGYYFPFSMEANYNDMMYIMNLPSTMCHELAHIKGYIYEDEANFLAYLACINSEDAFMQYSGYLGVLYYVENALQQLSDTYAQGITDGTLTPITQQVYRDSCFLTEEAWSEVEKKSFFSTDFVRNASDAFLENNLTVNGVEDGINSYSRVVRLMLIYEQMEK